jgi:hypothetical protein
VPLTLRFAQAITAQAPKLPAELLIDDDTGEVLNHDQVRDWEAELARFDRQPASMRAKAAKKNAACQAAALLFDAGKAKNMTQAAELIARADGIAVSTLERWLSKVWHQPRQYWQVILLESRPGRTVQAECDATAWDWYKGYFLTRDRPTHALTYRRLQRIAEKQVPAWVIPCARTLERRLDAEVSWFTQVLLRDGAEAMARLLPPMERDKTCFNAGEAVNGDGLKFDRLNVLFPDGEVLTTATAWFWQDINSGRILAWRAGKTENTDLFRLSVYDLTALCAPKYMWVDNTRVAANKLMTAGAEQRHRFKDDPEDGVGLLVQLGIRPFFTNPDQEMSNPGAKPIERAFGIGGLHEAVATHPRFTNRGRSRATAIPFAEFCEVLAEEVAHHNAQEKRRTRVCRGVLSFDQAWAEGVAVATPRRLSEGQRRLLLMAREVVTASRCRVRINAGRGPLGHNAYFSEHLAEFDGQKVCVHYDPTNLSAGSHIYSLDGRYLCGADHMPSVAFNDTETGREHAKFKARRLKARKAVADAETRMDAIERAALYNTASVPVAPAPAVAATNVVEAHFGKTPNPARDKARAAEHEDEFTSAVLSRLTPELDRKQANSI